jgi:ElaB/YqjD/DUF883 family membrane-anchored ribosome-binding protein
LLKTAASTGDEAFDSVRDKLTEQMRQMRDQLDELQESAAHAKRRP